MFTCNTTDAIVVWMWSNIQYNLSGNVDLDVNSPVNMPMTHGSFSIELKEIVSEEFSRSELSFIPNEVHNGTIITCTDLIDDTSSHCIISKIQLLIYSTS